MNWEEALKETETLLRAEVFQYSSTISFIDFPSLPRASALITDHMKVWWGDNYHLYPALKYLNDRGFTSDYIEIAVNRASDIPDYQVPEVPGHMIDPRKTVVINLGPKTIDRIIYLKDHQYEVN